MPTIFDYLPLIRAQFFIKNLFFCNFITWSYTLPLIFNTTQCAIVLARMRSLIYNGPKTVFFTQIISCCLSLSNIGHWAMGLACRIKSAEIAAYFNGILVTHAQYGKLPLPTRRGAKLGLLRDIVSTGKRMPGDVARGEMGRFALCIGIFTMIVPTILLNLLVLMLPCAMPHLLRSTFPDCAAEFVWDWGMGKNWAWAVTLVDMFSSGYGMCLACVAEPFVFHCGVTCVADHLKRTRNSLNLQSILAYRQAQILTTAVNNINQVGNLPIMITDLTWVGVTCLYAVIPHNSKLSVPAFLIAIVLGIDCTVVTSFILYKAGADLHQLSRDILQNWRGRKRMMRDGYLRRMKASCNALKIRIGSSGNFIEKATPLIIFQFSMEQVASLLLISVKQERNLHA
ncbi:hypothetical protein Fcan01_10127 [Folsomia candida]|uniref:Uncharacterized protein n=1 Tax=Folsomia candida TaxID=158441 RepID=A0A226EAM8_FOLCA|nr:hypothetical protein Fcan01_10127 [Folsomia candida]